MPRTRWIAAAVLSLAFVIVGTANHTGAAKAGLVSPIEYSRSDRTGDVRVSRSFRRDLLALETTTTSSTSTSTTSTTVPPTTTSTTTRRRVASTTTPSTAVRHTTPTTSTQRSYDTSAANARALGQQLAADHGWTGSQWNCLDSLWSKESGWDALKYNYGGSGAYGIPQALPGSKMASAATPDHPDWQHDPWVQIMWGLGYIDGKYVTPCGAWAHSQRYNSY